MRLWLGDLRNGVLPLHVAIELSTPGALAALWETTLDIGSDGLVDAVELLLLVRHHEQLTEQLRVGGFRPVVPAFATRHRWGEERRYAGYVESWIRALAEDARRSGDLYPRGTAIQILKDALLPLGPPSLEELVAAAARQTELLQRL